MLNSLLTKANLRTLIQQELDDPSAQRWSAPNLDLLTQVIFDEIYSDILEFAPWFNSFLDAGISAAPQLISPGFIDATQLTNRIFRVQKIIRASQEYYSIAQRDTLVFQNQEVVQPQFGYTFYGAGQIWIFPLDATATHPIDIRYNYLPPAYSALADNVTLTFPSSFEGALIHKTAARALIKGDVEDMQQHNAVAEEIMLKLKGSISKMYVGPIVPNLSDSPISWGSI